MEKQSPRALSNQPLIKSSPKDLSKNSKCALTKRGAHLLLQVRVKVLNEELQANFSKWYPQFEIKKAADSENSGELALAV